MNFEISVPPAWRKLSVLSEHFTHHVILDRLKTAIVSMRSIVQIVRRLPTALPTSLPVVFSILRRHASAIPAPKAESPILAALQSVSSNSALPAIIDSAGEHTAHRLLKRAALLSSRLQPNDPIAVFLPPDSSFVTTLLAAWRLGAAAVPLSPLFPAAALAPLLQTVTPSAIVTSNALRHALPSTPQPIITIDDLSAEEGEINESEGPASSLTPSPSSDSLIFFTSGTTGAPKGVVWTHDMLAHQLETLSSAWRWSSADRIVNVLPLHHIHGLVNVVLCALHNGATLEMHSAFDAYSVWAAITRRETLSRPTVFMAVPSIYRRLIAHYETASPAERNRMRNAAATMRLFVCGSAALPRTDFDAWLSITGHRILERYGMTETGMTLSNTYDDRRCGLLGAPLPGVSVRLASDPDGELQVKGPGVFPYYWNDPERTRQAFTEDGYFRTGDVVEQDPESGYYRLLGRANADFVKTGGYKVSTLEVEDIVCGAPGVQDCCVLGLPDNTLGERIVAALIVTRDASNDIIDLVRSRTEEMLPRYKVPRDFYIVDSLPRNVLGKVQKQILRSRLLT